MKRRFCSRAIRAESSTHYSIPVGGGTPAQLTHSKETTFAVSYFPNDERILLTRDVGGNENNHLYALSSDGTERDLTPGARVKAAFLGWAADDEAFYLQVNERNPRFFDVYRVSRPETTRGSCCTPMKRAIRSTTSPRREISVFVKVKTTVDSDLYLYNVSTKEMKRITPHDGQATHSGAEFSPDSKALYYLTNRGAEFAYVERMRSGYRAEARRR